MKVPVAPVRPSSRSFFGITLTDDYAWLRDRENPDTLAYLEAENAFTQARTAHTQALQEKLYQEMLGRIQETDLSVPFRMGGWLYYFRTEAGKAYRIWCRKRGAAGTEEVLLDENALAAGHEFFSLAALEISPDGNLMAYAVDLDGSEQYSLHFRDLRTGTALPDQILNTGGSLEWAADNRHVFYVMLDDAHRPYKVLRHELGSAEADTEVFHEADESFFVGLGKSQDEQYIFISTGSITSAEAWYLRSDTPREAFICISPRQKDHEYSVEHHEGRFYFRTNLHARDFRLAAAPAGVSAPDSWEEVLPGQEGAPFEDFLVLRDHMVLQVRREGQSRFVVLDLRQGGMQEVAFPETVYAISFGTNAEYETALFRFQYDSFTVPPTVYDLELNTQARTLLKQKEVPGYAPEQYESQRVFATAADGVQVPVSLVYRKGISLNGQNPLFLYGYGSYGVIEETHFNSNRFSLLDRGFVFAMAHIRGGGTLGRGWYESGKFLQKKNTFTDFIACAEHLHTAGWSIPAHTVIMGGSAGGLLMGAVLNQRPDLFQAAIAHVPFVDVMNTMLDPSLPLTVTEYEEWGNPQEEAYFRYMHSYSPCDNVVPRPYPHLLITGGLNDPRVGYWEPAKWCARLRQVWNTDRELLLKTNMEAGHQGRSGRYEALKEAAFDYAFMLDKLGVQG